MSWTKALLIFLGIYVAYLFVDRFDPESVKGKRVVVTGASTGIGEEIAYNYAKMGARILITARRENVLQKVVKKCLDLGALEAFYLPLDMGKMEDTKRLIDEAEKRFGGLDHLILNHITRNKLELWDGQYDHLDDIYNVNFKSYVSLATYALPMLKKSHGSMAVMSSFAGKSGVPYSAAYSASKFALLGFFESLRQEFTLQNIDISITICIIGGIKTENALAATKGIVNPMAFMGSPEETALAVIKGTTKQERELYFPWIETRPVTLVKAFFPSLIDWVARIPYTKET
ncbi:hydroxysteroid 11-beta-dehydrogenase 1-like protein [Glandiceps talaboti]